MIFGILANHVFFFFFFKPKQIQLCFCVEICLQTHDSYLISITERKLAALEIMLSHKAFAEQVQFQAPHPNP